MNSPETKKKNKKIMLLIFAAIIGLSSLIYTNILVSKLQVEEKQKIELRIEATKQLIKATDGEFIVFLFENIINNNDMATIIADSNDVVLHSRGLDSTKTFDANNEPNKIYDPKYFQEQLAIMKEQHEPIIYEVIPGEKQFIYYKDSSILMQLKIYPYFQLAIIAVFLFVSYLAFSASRKSEQNRVWVGLAKETAHQLGTPISSLLAWVEHLKNKISSQDLSIVEEMENDIKKLEIVADRFSKIGSVPVLKSENVYDTLERNVAYIRKRTSEKISFEITGDKNATAQINHSLFDWVIENLCNNAINAIGIQGAIKLNIIQQKNKVFIDIADTGAGIPKSKFETVFEPGYTTRKRGWGLGLSLVRRIIENYHNGQIVVKESVVGKGSTFRITLHA
jgi:signal transduction histidine kinase